MEKLLTVQQLSELIQVKRSTLYEWTHVGFIPHYKFPKGIRFKEIEIVNWLRKRHRGGRNTIKIDLESIA